MTHAALVVVQVAFASQTVEAKLAMMPVDQGGEGMSPLALCMARMIGAAAFFHGVAALFGKPHDRPMVARGHGKLILLALLGVAINQALFLAGLRLATPFVAALLVATIPVFTAALAVLFRKEAPSWRTGLGILLALGGVLSLTGWISFRSDLGAVLVTANSLSYAAYVVFARDAVRDVGAIRLTAWVFFYGALVFAPVGMPALVSEASTMSPRGAWLLGYIVVVPTILAYGLNAWALGRTTASTVTIYIYLQPLFAAVLGRVQLGYSISSRAGFAACLIFAGVFVTTWKRPWLPRQIGEPIERLRERARVRRSP